MSTTYLVTGATRGIGKGLVAAYLSRPNATVVAAVRDPAGSNSRSLESLPKGANSTLIVVKIDSTSDTDAEEAVRTLQSKHAVAKLDVVIANSGISNYYGKSSQTPLSEMREHFEVNTLGPLKLFQAALPLLQAAGPGAKFVPITSAASSIADMEHFPLMITAYGPSKAALNFVARKIHYEYPDIITFPLNPGWVQTEMGNAGAIAAGMTEAAVKLQDCIDGMTSVIDTATRESTSGTFASFDGVKWHW